MKTTTHPTILPTLQLLLLSILSFAIQVTPLSYTLHPKAALCLLTDLKKDEYMTSEVFVKFGVGLDIHVKIDGPLVPSTISSPSDLSLSRSFSSPPTLSEYHKLTTPPRSEIITDYNDMVINYKVLFYDIADMIGGSSEGKEDVLEGNEKIAIPSGWGGGRWRREMKKGKGRRGVKKEEQDAGGDGSEDLAQGEADKEEEKEEVEKVEEEAGEGASNELKGEEIDENEMPNPLTTEPEPVPVHRRLLSTPHKTTSLASEGVTDPTKYYTFQAQSSGWYRACIINDLTSGYGVKVVDFDIRQSNPTGSDALANPVWQGDTDIDSGGHLSFLEVSTYDITDPTTAKDTDIQTLTKYLKKVTSKIAEIKTQQTSERHRLSIHSSVTTASYGRLVVFSVFECVVFLGVVGVQIYVVKGWFGGKDGMLGMSGGGGVSRAWA